MAETKQKSDLSRAFSEDGTLKTHVGGQALLEGIMMRGKLNWAVAVREPDGVIYTEEHELASGKDKNSWLYWPFIRGCRAFVESLTLGYKALSIAAEHAFVEEIEEGEEGEGEGAAALSASASSVDGEAASIALADGDASVAPADGDAASVAPADGNASVVPADDDAALIAPADGDASVAPADATAAAGDASQAASGASATNAVSGNASEAAAAAPHITNEVPEERKFSWKRDFGNPDEMIDALAAQRTLEVIDGDTGLPVRFEDTVEGNDASSSPDEQESVVSAPASASADAATEQKPEKKPLLGDTEMAISMILGLVLGVALFIVVPAFVTNLLVGEYDEHTLAWNLVDGLLRIAVFIFYIWLIGRMSDIKRMFGYHGAEHKTIHCFEHGLPLTPENARSFPRLHVRCGTAFLIMVMIIAIFVYTITPLNALISAWGVPDGPIKLALVIVVRILLMPVIAGISYEITVKWAGSHPDNPLVKVILWPGMQMQYLTTREPDDGQIECAIAAMRLVLEREQQAEAATGVSA